MTTTTNEELTSSAVPEVPEVWSFDTNDPDVKWFLALAKSLNRAPQALCVEMLRSGLQKRRLKTGADLLREEIENWEQNKGTAGDYLNLEIVIKSKNELGKYPDTLLRDESDRLYLVYCNQSLDVDGEEVYLVEGMGSACRAPLAAIREGQIEPCSVQEALEWFSTCSEFMTAYDGDESILCGIAAEELERLSAKS